jgi:endoglucanase
MVVVAAALLPRMVLGAEPQQPRGIVDFKDAKAVMADPFFQKLKPAFGRGMNLGNALEAPKEGDWGVTLRKEFFQKIKEAGFDTVRLPICWATHAAGSAPYKIDPKFFERVNWTVNLCHALRLTLILDMHHDNELMENPDKYRERYLALWRQIAQHYQDCPSDVAFELLNEPHGNLNAEKWNKLLAEAIAVIRSTNPTRPIVVGPVGWNGIGELGSLELPEKDRNLVVTVHYYNPFKFTHQGASWVGDQSQKWLGTKWLGDKAEQQAIERDLDTAIAWAVQHRRPMFLGEFGAYDKADLESRARWTRFVAQETLRRKMGYAYWEFCAGFGVYDPVKNKWIEPLKDALLPKSPQK